MKAFGVSWCKVEYLPHVAEQLHTIIPRISHMLSYIQHTAITHSLATLSHQAHRCMCPYSAKATEANIIPRHCANHVRRHTSLHLVLDIRQSALGVPLGLCVRTLGLARDLVRLTCQPLAAGPAHSKLEQQTAMPLRP
jgi:hypothetical protein